VTRRDGAGSGSPATCAPTPNRVDYARFRVLPASSDAVTGTRADGNGGDANGGKATPLPDQAGTDQVGTDQTGAQLGAGEDGGLDPVWLLLPTALLLVVLAVVLRLLRTARPQQ
jgi:hypothetical protein